MLTYENNQCSIFLWSTITKLGDKNQIVHNALMKEKYNADRNDCQNLSIFVHSYSRERHMVASRSL